MKNILKFNGVLRICMRLLYTDILVDVYRKDVISLFKIKIVIKVTPCYKIDFTN